MRRFTTIAWIIFTFASCDCIQQATGVILDRQTRRPIDNVIVSRHEKCGPGMSDSIKSYSNDKGIFDYHCISGGVMKCPNLVLCFSRKGYQPAKITFESSSKNDTVYLDKIVFNRDSSTSITLPEFIKLVDDCTALLQSKQLTDITDEQHIDIMMCLNTIFICGFKDGRYDELIKTVNQKNYTKEIINIFKEWLPNRGMGFYFPKLQMELYGTPSRYAIYTVMK